MSLPGRTGAGGRKKKRGARPVAVVCYICGRQYGRSSLGIHLKQCKKLWEQREALKPPHERKPLPAAPANLERAVATGDIRHMSDRAINQQNSAAFDAYNNDALEKCPHCGRSFLPKPLEIHLKSCRPGRLIGTKLKAHSGKAGGNLGAGANPASKRPGSAPRPGVTGNRGGGGGGGGRTGRGEGAGGRRERVPIRERLEARRLSGGRGGGSGGGGGGGGGGFEMLNEDDDGGGDGSRYGRRAPSTAPSSSASGYSSSIAASAARHLAMDSGAGSRRDDYEDGDGGGGGGRGGSGDHDDDDDLFEAPPPREEWHEAFDPKSGRNFYYNASGETRWTLPAKGSAWRSPTTTGLGDGGGGNDGSGEAVDTAMVRRNRGRASNALREQQQQQQQQQQQPQQQEQSELSESKISGGARSGSSSSSSRSSSSSNSSLANRPSRRSSAEARSSGVGRRARKTAKRTEDGSGGGGGGGSGSSDRGRGGTSPEDAARIARLEAQVSDLTSKLEFAMSEIGRLSRVMDNFKNVFSGN